MGRTSGALLPKLAGSAQVRDEDPEEDEKNPSFQSKLIPLGLVTGDRNRVAERRLLTSVPPDVRALTEWLIKPLFYRLADLPVWHIHGGAVVKLSEGLFLAPPGVEREGKPPPPSVGEFLQAHYRVFRVPWDLTRELEGAGVNFKELTPKMLRSLLRSPEVAEAVKAVETQVDLLEYCCADIIMERQQLPAVSTTSSLSSTSDIPPPGAASRGMAPLPREPESRPMVSSLGGQNRTNRNERAVREPSGLMVALDQMLGRNENGSVDTRVRDWGYRENWGNGTQSGSGRANQDATAGADPLAIVAELGRALVEVGREVLEGPSRNLENSGGGGAGEGGGVEQERSAVVEEPRDPFDVNRAAVMELKGILIPTAANRMVRIGAGELIIATSAQQALLPAWSQRVVHPACLSRSVLQSLFSHTVVKELLLLKVFTAQLLAQGIGNSLPRQWAPRAGGSSSQEPWVMWNPPAVSRNGTVTNVGSAGHPTVPWLRTLWANVNVDQTAELDLFGGWPLIPAQTGGSIGAPPAGVPRDVPAVTVASPGQSSASLPGTSSGAQALEGMPVLSLLVKVEHRQVVFVPPEAGDPPAEERWADELEADNEPEGLGLGLGLRDSHGDGRPRPYSATTGVDTGADRTSRASGANVVPTPVSVFDEAVGVSLLLNPPSPYVAASTSMQMQQPRGRPVAGSGPGSETRLGSGSASTEAPSEPSVSSEQQEMLKRKGWWRYRAIEKNKPWLLPLLKRLGVPVFDARFVDSAVLRAVAAPESGSSGGLPKLVVTKLLALQRIGRLPQGDALVLSPSDCDHLFSLFASHLAPAHRPILGSRPPTPSTYHPSELELLRSLPIYRTAQGSYRTVDPAVHCIVPPGVFFQPADDRCLQHRGEAEADALYRALEIPELGDEEVMAKFALPGFDGQSEREQERTLGYLLANWSRLKQQPAVVAALRETKFVIPGSPLVKVSALPDQSEPPVPPSRVRPCDLLDPANPLLRKVFGDEPERFPGQEFASARWLPVLRDGGLRSTLDAPLLLECARKVETMGKEEMGRQQEGAEGGLLLGTEMETETVNGISAELWSVAGQVVEAVLANFATLFGSQFCEPLRDIRFVPAERGIPTGGGGDHRTLASYSEALLLRDWPLGWSVAPVLARTSMVPPDFAWGILQLRSPPPFAMVLKHLQKVGETGGEEALARWPTGRAGRSVEEAFGDVLQYLSNTWDGLARTETEVLKATCFIPVANGTRLVPPSALYTRLGMDLAPFAFQLPHGYLPYARVLAALGMQDAPSVSGMRTLLGQLQRACGYQRLNPNELRAVLRILTFICGDAENGGDRPHDDVTLTWQSRAADDAVVPDDGARLVAARMCVYVDPAGARLLGEIDTSRVRFVHPRVKEAACKALGVRKLSDVVVEELDERQPLECLEAIGQVALARLARALRRDEFLAATWAVLQEHAEVVPALRSLSWESVQRTLDRAAEGLRFVRILETRFILLPNRLDITLREAEKSAAVLRSGTDFDESLATTSSSVATSQSGPRSSARPSADVIDFADDVSSMPADISAQQSSLGHRVYDFVDTARGLVYIAQPPAFVPLSALLAAVLSRLLGSPVSLPLGPLLQGPPSIAPLVRRALRLGLPEGMLEPAVSRGGREGVGSPGAARSVWAQRSLAERNGLPGMEVSTADAALVQCHPLRPFHAGEVVAWRQEGGLAGPQGGGDWGGSTEQQPLRYGRVVEDCRASAGQALYRVQVETGPGEIRLLLSSSVLSFKSTTAAATAGMSAAPLSQPARDAASFSSPSQHADGHASSSLTSATAASSTASSGRSLEATEGSTGGRVGPATGSTTGGAASAVPAAEVARAVRDMLAAAGMPMGAEQGALLERALALQEQVAAADAALQMEQERADGAVREAEQAKTSWQCRICLSNDVSAVLTPCGHVLCEGCSTAVNRCPFCRRPVTRAQRMYRP